MAILVELKGKCCYFIYIFFVRLSYATLKGGMFPGVYSKKGRHLAPLFFTLHRPESRFLLPVREESYPA